MTTPPLSAGGDQLDAHRAALYTHCYRMLGSTQDAEDAVQETLLNGWRALASFDGRGSLRAWLWSIATNVCLRMIERRPARLLPVAFGPPTDPRDPLGPPLVESTWIEPFPDGALDGDAGLTGPAGRYEQREAVELAFIAALQHLPPRQRAVLILRDVLGFSGAEVAKALDATPAGVYSLLQRAHATLDARLPDRTQQATLRALGDGALQAIVDRFVEAWTTHDVDAIVELLTEDATLAMPPTASWNRGRADVAIALRGWPLAPGKDWRLLPISANGQPAAGAYLRDAAGVHRLHSVLILTFAGERIAAIDAFHDPATPERFGLTPQL